MKLWRNVQEFNHWFRKPTNHQKSHLTPISNFPTQVLKHNKDVFFKATLDSGQNMISDETILFNHLSSQQKCPLALSEIEF